MLSRFGKKLSQARQAYERFVGEGIKAGRRPELMGGGLLRSAGGLAGVRGRSLAEREAYDGRVLGGGGFVESVLKEVEGADTRRAEHQRQGTTIHSLAEKIAKEEGVSVKSLFERGRREGVSRGKAVLIHLGVTWMGKSNREMAILTKMSDPAASKARTRGAEYFEESRLNKLLS